MGIDRWRTAAESMMLAACLSSTSGCGNADATELSPKARVAAYVNGLGGDKDDVRIGRVRAYGNELAMLVDEDLRDAKDLDQASALLFDLSACLTIAYGWRAQQHILQLQEALADTPVRRRRLLAVIGHPTASKLMQDVKCGI